MSDDLVEQLFRLGMDSMEYDVNGTYDPAPTEESTLIHEAVHEIKLLRAFVASVSDVVEETHFPTIAYQSGWTADEGFVGRELIVCDRCSRVSGLPEMWPCAVYRVVHPSAGPLAELVIIGIRHMQHSQMCDCLDHSSECCNPSCDCHPKTDEGAVDTASSQTDDPFTVEFTQVDAAGNVSTHTDSTVSSDEGN